ncbi:MAG TPA: hypothetical protein ENN92_00290, partial [candidate division WWE3 bacterium]|nr:hypothetical protein [candidate division WWE3 bacterium]
MALELTNTYTKTALSNTLGFSRDLFYYDYDLEEKDLIIVSQILDLYEEDDSLGAKKVSRLLGIGKNRCQRIMNKYGIHPRRKKGIYKYSGKSDTTFKNVLLEQDLDTFPDIYFSDYFEFKLADKTEVHGCFVLKYSTRQITALIFDYFEDSSLIVKALEETKEYLKGEGIFHSDQGSVYGSDVTVIRIKDLGLQISMSRAGTPTDNGYAERFVGIFKLA